MLEVFVDAAAGGVAGGGAGGGAAAVWDVAGRANVLTTGMGHVVIETYNKLSSRQKGQFNLTVWIPQAGDVDLYREEIRAAQELFGYHKHQFKYQCEKMKLSHTLQPVITQVGVQTDGGPGHDHVIVEVTCRQCSNHDFK